MILLRLEIDLLFFSHLSSFWNEPNWMDNFLSQTNKASINDTHFFSVYEWIISWIFASMFWLVNLTKMRINLTKMRIAIFLIYHSRNLSIVVASDFITIILARKMTDPKTKSGFECLLIYRSGPYPDRS